MAKPGPIPLHLEPETRTSLGALSERSGASQASIIRRCVEFSLDLVKQTGRIDFLFDKEAAEMVLQETAAASHSATAARLPQEPVRYPAKPKATKRAQKAS